MMAIAVEGPSTPPMLELVDPRSREWERIDREQAVEPGSRGYHRSRKPSPRATAWNSPPGSYRTPVGVEQIGAMIFLHGGPEGQSRPGYNEFFLSTMPVSQSLTPNIRGSGGFGRSFHACRRQGAAVRSHRRCRRLRALPGRPRPAREDRIACCGWSYGGYLTQAALTFHPGAVRRRHQHCGISDLATFYRNTEPWIAAATYPKYGHPINDRELLDRLSPLLRVEALIAPLLFVHGANDTNVPPSESQQMFDALRRLGRTVECLMFDDDGHQIVERENREALVLAIKGWLTTVFAQIPIR